MSDEIEIEEHDLLNDPTVRNIFPDISRLKQEILDYEYNEDREPSSTSDSYFDDINNPETSIYEAEKKDDVQPNYQNNGLENGFTRGDKGIEMQICNNKIILGSKPVNSFDESDHFERNIKPFCAVVSLEDFGLFLRNCSRYCNLCLTLFPTILEYNDHVKNMHHDSAYKAEGVQGENMVAACNNIEKTGEKKIEEGKGDDRNKEFNTDQEKTEKVLLRIDENSANICHICKATFKKRKYLNAHVLNVHTRKNNKPGVVKLKKPLQRSREVSKSERNECFHCKKSFRTQHLLIEHIYSILQSPKNSSDTYANKILIGKKTNSGQSSMNLIEEPKVNKATKKNDAKIASEDNSTQQMKRYFSCRFCFQYFKTTKIYVRHMRNKHNVMKNIQMTKVAFDPKCKHCSKIYDGVDAYNSHVRKLHPREIKKLYEAIHKSTKPSSIEGKGIISQNGFYRCDFCSLYFNNLTFVTRHIRIKHKVVKIAKPKKVQYDPKCKFCSGMYPNVKRYNIHLHRIHSSICKEIVKTPRKILSHSHEKESDILPVANIAPSVTQKELVYKCNICPLYFTTLHFLTRHLKVKHKIVNTPKVKKVEFNPICKYCSHVKNDDICRTVRAYNCHIYKTHPELLNKIIRKSKTLKVNANKNKVVVKRANSVKTIKKSITPKNVIRRATDMLYYRCYICPMYFKSVKYIALHLRVKHKTELFDPNLVPKERVVFNPKCKYCPTIARTFKGYNKHVYSKHWREFTDKNKKSSLINKNVQNNMQQADVKKVADIKGKMFYRCCYCSYYFNSISIHNSHVLRKHRVKSTHKVTKIAFDPNCKYCPIEVLDEKAYNKHLHSSHQHRVNEVFRGKINRSKSSDLAKRISLPSITKDMIDSDNGSLSISMEHKTNKDILNINPIAKSALFKCHKCDIHFITVKTALDHSNHMEMLINWKCSLCNRIFKDNDRWLHEQQHLFSHVFTVYDLNTENISHILYKCSKCVLHFDESIVDSHHYDCVSKIPESYICNICDILIDCNAKICHEYNHKHRLLTSTDFIIIETDVVFDSNKSKTKPVKNKIDKEIINSVENTVTFAGGNQEKGTNKNQQIKLKRKLNSTENIQVLSKKLKKNDNAGSTHKKEADNICNAIGSNTTTINQQRYDRLLLKLSFCNTCKSFVSFIGHKRKEHAEGRCAHLLTQVCKDCGLRFSCKTLSTHKQIHFRVKNLSLQHFKFYDFNSGKRVHPPMPEYEKCEICDVNFISKSSLGHHICSDNEYKACDICDLKIYIHVFHLHMAFHKYKFSEESFNHKSYNVATAEKKTTVNKTTKNTSLTLYSCKVCNIFVDTYDRVIEHCQSHCLTTLPIYSEECKICNFKLEGSSLATHAKVHEQFGIPTFEKLYFDPFYFRFNNRVWLNHVFGTYPKEMVQDILLNSAYQFEHRFKMYIVQEGRVDLMLYKCNKCDRHVDPNFIYNHIENSCSNLRKFPCPICHLDFISSVLLKTHKSTHEDPTVTMKSYRIVHFNRQEDAELNIAIFSPPKLYVLYQCRHCNGIVNSIHRMSHICNENILKSCTNCGLLISEDIYETHLSKHDTLDSFISENIKVILFGEHESYDKKFNSKLIPTFRGKIHDYSFYKCQKCHVCFKDKKLTVSHMCCFKGSRVACSKCGLYFNTDKLIAHTKIHESDPDFVLDNMNFIEFQPTFSKPTNDKLKLNDESEDKEASIESKSVNELEKINLSSATPGNDLPPDNEIKESIDVEKIAEFYKCCCGLHFLDEISYTEHRSHCGPKTKQAKQNCSKCGLLFTPSVLFKHLLTHHGDKQVSYKFVIIDKSNNAS